MPTLLEIVTQYLKEHGYDGLYNTDDECGCSVDNLMSCDGMTIGCQAGWKGPCDCGDHDWHMGNPLCVCGHTRSKHPVGYNEGCLRVGCGCKEYKQATKEGSGDDA
jgi:hypothetical protein